MRSLQVLALLLTSSGLCACELIADFDRGKLDAGRPVDAALPGEPSDLDPALEEDAGAVDAGRQ